MDSNDKLIELGLINPEYANIVQEFMRLKELTDNPAVAGHLNIMIQGLLREADEYKQEGDPFMYPMGIQSPTRIETVDVNGEPTSVWYSNSFHHRLEFLQHGRLCVTYPNKATIVPLCLRLDVNKCVTIKEEGE